MALTSRREEIRRVMRKIFCTLLLFVLLGNGGFAQQRLVNEVKKDIGGMSLTVDNYKAALKKINVALGNEETRAKAETWWVAGKIQYSIYDKMMNNKASGEKIKSTEAGLALLDGYEKFQESLSRDTVWRVDKKGNPIIDKKTKKQKIATKYSQDIMNRVVDHVVDYSAVAGDFYLASDWNNAYKAWEIYCSIAKSEWVKQKKKEEPDSIVGYNRFFQGLAAYQAGDNENAVRCMEKANALGYRKKPLYDTWIDALIKLQDTIYMVSVAHEAHDRLGARDPRYVRILINYYLRNKSFDEAQLLLDEVIASDSTVAEYYGLKGRLVETQESIDAALPLYRKAVELVPESSMGLFDLGKALYNKALTESDPRSDGAKELFIEALPYLEKSYKINPRNSDLKKILSRIYYVLGSNKIDEL